MNQEEMKELKKELKITRYCTILTALLLVVVIIGGITVVNMFSPVITAIEEIQPVMERISELDVEMLNEKIAQFDIEGINKAIAGLDTEELSKTLSSINEVVEILEEAGEKFGNFSNSINSSFSGLFGNMN